MKKLIPVVVAAVALAAVIVGVRAQEGSGAKKTLIRTEDPVVVTADKLGDMKDAAIDKLALFAYSGDAFAPIPFQVDEKTEAGTFVYTDGPEANAKDGDRKVNGKDELVFMVWDTGDMAPDSAALPCSPVRSSKLEIKDPKDSGAAWVYLAECGGDPVKSDKDYVRNEYDGKRDWVKTDRYHFAEQRGTTYFDRLALKGKDGKVGENEADRIKGRTKFSAAAGLIDLNPGESDLSGSIQAWIDGPVRTVHLMKAFIGFSVIKLNIGGQSENLFYPNYFVTPIQLNTPINPGSVLSTFTMRYTIDWRANMDGVRYYDPVNKKGVVLDGKMSEDEKNMDYETSHDWYALTGDQGNLVVRMIVPEQWSKLVPLKLYYVDDVTKLDPPEDDPGQRCPGFYMDKMIDIPAGDYKYYLYYMVPDKAPPASVPSLLDMIDKPLEVSSTKM